MTRSRVRHARIAGEPEGAKVAPWPRPSQRASRIAGDTSPRSHDPVVPSVRTRPGPDRASSKRSSSSAQGRGRRAPDGSVVVSARARSSSARGDPHALQLPGGPGHQAVRGSRWDRGPCPRWPVIAGRWPRLRRAGPGPHPLGPGPTTRPAGCELLVGGPAPPPPGTPTARPGLPRSPPGRPPDAGAGMRTARSWTRREGPPSGRLGRRA